MIWVLDASIAVRWFIEEEFHEHTDQILRKIVDHPEQFAVPELFAFEVYAVLQRVHPDAIQTFRNGIIPILQSGIFRQPMTETLAVKANCYTQFGLTGYDACYAALAEDLKGLWLTFDKKAHHLIQKERISCLISERMPEDWYEY